MFINTTEGNKMDGTIKRHMTRAACPQLRDVRRRFLWLGLSNVSRRSFMIASESGTSAKLHVCGM